MENRPKEIIHENLFCLSVIDHVPYLVQKTSMSKTTIDITVKKIKLNFLLKDFYFEVVTNYMYSAKMTKRTKDLTPSNF